MSESEVCSNFSSCLIVSQHSNLTNVNKFNDVRLRHGLNLYRGRGVKDIPRSGIKSGLSPCGNVYVGLICHSGTPIPSKIIPAYNVSYYAYRGREYSSNDKIFMVTENDYTYQWVATTANDELPSNAAFIAAIDDSITYIGRVTMDGEKCVGKVDPIDRLCYVPKTGKEFLIGKYDILCIVDKNGTGFQSNSKKGGK